MSEDAGAATMRALRIHDRGRLRGLAIEASVPRLGIGDVLVAVRGASFTPTELSWPSTWTDRQGQPAGPIAR
jgi:hypothetical protein